MTIDRRRLLTLAALGGLHPLLAAKPPTAHARLDAELAAIADYPSCPLASLSVLAMRHGEVAYQRQFGLRSMSDARPANAHTLYRMASISKMMTTLAAMRLIENDLLALDDDVSTYLGFTLRNPHFPEHPITLRALLTHTASLRDDAGYSWPGSVTLASVLVPGAANYAEGAMWARNAPPGAYFTYANLGWGIIGTIMEAATGERFDRLMHGLLIAPLGLHGGFNPAAFSTADLANLATLYRKRTVDTEVWNPAFPWIAQADDYSAQPPAPITAAPIGTNATPFSPTGGLRLSAEDMGIVMRMLINGGRHVGRQYLKPATLATMFSRQWTLNADGSNGDSEHGLYQCWGLGNQHFPHQLVEGGGYSAVGHLGDAYGLQSVFAVDLASGNGMVVLIGGVGADPATIKGSYSSLPRFEERILTALHRQVLAR
ncbi:MAG: serine hydrolase domain-containing protein [Massilia sp.]